MDEEIKGIADEYNTHHHHNWEAELNTVGFEDAIQSTPRRCRVGVFETYDSGYMYGQVYNRIFAKREQTKTEEVSE